MSDVMLALVATEAREAIKNETTLENRLRTAMKAAANHWMVLDRDTQFRGAVAAVYEVSDEDDRQRIEQELDALKFINAMLSGVPVDMDRRPKAENPIGLTKLWTEAIRP